MFLFVLIVTVGVWDELRIELVLPAVCPLSGDPTRDQTTTSSKCLFHSNGIVHSSLRKGHMSDLQWLIFKNVLCHVLSSVNNGRRAATSFNSPPLIYKPRGCSGSPPTGPHICTPQIVQELIITAGQRSHVNIQKSQNIIKLDLRSYRSCTLSYRH